MANIVAKGKTAKVHTASHPDSPLMGAPTCGKGGGYTGRAWTYTTTEAALTCTRCIARG
jgi:hypothetical protein